MVAIYPDKVLERLMHPVWAALTYRGICFFFSASATRCTNSILAFSSSLNAFSKVLGFVEKYLPKQKLFVPFRVVFHKYRRFIFKCLYTGNKYEDLFQVIIHWQINRQIDFSRVCFFQKGAVFIQYKIFILQQ